MGSTSALLTGLSGLNANTRRLEVIGNNISNSSTTAFKSSRINFSTTLLRNFGLGSGPSGVNGGTNPFQVGLGVRVAGTQRDLNVGPINPTGRSTDMALDGEGYFIVDRGGRQLYTRAGEFQLNSERQLTTLAGDRVQGYAVDQNFNIVQGQLTDLTIPLGALSITRATSNVFFQGNLLADVDNIATQGDEFVFNDTFLDQATGTPIAGAAALIDNLQDPSAAPGTALFPSGGSVPYEFTLSGVMKGSRTLPDATLTIDATTTMNDFVTFVNNALGIDETETNPMAPPATMGASYDAATGQLSIFGNLGEDNQLNFDNSTFGILDSTGATVSTDYSALTQNAAADGESASTRFTVYDSLGNPLDVVLTMTLTSATTNGPTNWRYIVETPENADATSAILPPDLVVGAGTIDFDSNGQIVTTAPVNVNIQRDNLGSEDPLNFNLNFASDRGNLTALMDAQDDADSLLASNEQDGIPFGVLDNFNVGKNGIITGAFTNGLTRTIGQVAVANFTNPGGLVETGDSLFSVGSNSGTPIITTAGQFGTGSIIERALEGSNVDLANEFTNMILTTTGYSASSRVITTSDQLLQQLTNLIR
jgi:flagellar hook protein FlgE